MADCKLQFPHSVHTAHNCEDGGDVWKALSTAWGTNKTQQELLEVGAWGSYLFVFSKKRKKIFPLSEPSL